MIGGEVEIKYYLRFLKADICPSYLKIRINIHQCKESGRVGEALKVMDNQPSLSGRKIEPR
jgi:hypothetical protein